jgi:hypothetical protein
MRSGTERRGVSGDPGEQTQRLHLKARARILVAAECKNGYVERRNGYKLQLQVTNCETSRQLSEVFDWTAEHSIGEMGNRSGESGEVLKLQLRELYEEIERTKKVQLELLKVIWPDRVWDVRLTEPEYLLAVRMECCN